MNIGGIENREKSPVASSPPSSPPPLDFYAFLSFQAVIFCPGYELGEVVGGGGMYKRSVDDTIKGSEVNIIGISMPEM